VREAEAAYALRDQLMPWERGLVDGMYAGKRGDRDRSIDEYQRLLEDIPELYPAINNLGVQYQYQREFGLAERLFRSVTDTTLRQFDFSESAWLRSLINLGRLGAVDSLLEIVRAAGADTGSSFDAIIRSRLVAEREYHEIRALDASESLGRSPNQYDRFRQLGVDQNTALVLGQLVDYESMAAELSGTYSDLDDGRGVLLQAIAMARARHRFLDDSAGAQRVLEEALGRQPFDQLEVLDRPYPQLASVRAELGDVDEAERLVERWESEVPAEYQGIDRHRVDLARGDIALATGRAEEALDFYRRGDIFGCVPCNQPRFARAWEALNQTDSAIAAYERYVLTPSTARASTDAFELANAYLRLGELYEERGDRDNSVRYDNELIELWREADPHLLRQVADVRERVARLLGEPQR